ncbi:MAG TPA: hypothetical protein ENN03_10335 [bacterium]|nr:hypothetical protein [bacterium]
MRRYLIIVCGFLMLLRLPARAGSRFEVSGTFKHFSILLIQPRFHAGDDTHREPDLGAASSRMRLQIEYQPMNRLSLQIAYDISPRIQDIRLFQSGTFLQGFQPAGYTGSPIFADRSTRPRIPRRRVSRLTITWTVSSLPYD